MLGVFLVTSLKLLLHRQPQSPPQLYVVCGFVGVAQFTVQGHYTPRAALQRLMAHQTDPVINTHPIIPKPIINIDVGQLALTLSPQTRSAAFSAPAGVSVCRLQLGPVLASCTTCFSNCYHRLKCGEIEALLSVWTLDIFVQSFYCCLFVRLCS